MRKTLLISLSIILSTIVVAQEKKYDLITDRPDQTESSSTVPKRSLQIETGFLYENNDGIYINDINLFYNSTLLRYGLFDNLELRFGIEYLNSKDEYKNRDTIYDVTGFAPLVAGLKIAISEQNGIIPEMALLTHLVLPRTGQYELMQRVLSPEIILSAGWDINTVFSTGINFGSVWESAFYGYVRRPKAIYSWVLGVSINEKLASYVETYGSFGKYQDLENRIDGGLTYLILPNLQFDVSGGFGNSKEEPYYFVSCGLSVLILR